MSITETTIPGYKLFKKGKVRDVYDLNDKLLIISTDRISAFDVILPTPIPGKGKVLTQISKFWFKYISDIIDNHLITTSLTDLDSNLQKYADQLKDRFMLTKKASVIPFECVVRGYLAGSGWKEYQESKTVCKIPLKDGLKLSSQLQEPIFTPATKAEVGHDENISFDQMANSLGKDLATKIKEISIKIYLKAAKYAKTKGIIIADTKFEFGLIDNKLIIVDEVLTPDSSRFWPLEGFKEGMNQPSFDKQFIRDYLETLDWDKTYPGPELPKDIVDKTSAKYKKIVSILTS